jgi:phage-related baseplate assembly protein
MPRYGAIDLSAYQLPDILEVLAVEAYLLRNKDLFIAAWDAIRGEQPSIDTLALEHEPATAQLRVAAELERLLRGHVNDRTKAVTLAGARGAMLDHLAMTYFGGLTRRMITPASSATPVVMEDDETFRQRIALSPESWSTCGPEGAYLFWALSASGDVLDVAAYSEDEGTCLAPHIRVVVLGRAGMTQAPQALNAAVKASLDRTSRRPMGDLVTVESAVEVPFDVTLTLAVRAGASAELVRAQAEARIRAYCEGRLRWAGDGVEGPVWLIGRRIGRDTLAGVASGGDQNIVEVTITAPVSDVNAPNPAYTAGALAGVGDAGFVPLDATLTAHLFRAPRLGALTVNTVPAATGLFT